MSKEYIIACILDGETGDVGGGVPEYFSSREVFQSVVECLTRDRGAAGSNLTGVTALWFLSKTHLS